jgi:hypothetical protein
MEAPQSRTPLGRSLLREMTTDQIAAWLHRLPRSQTTKRQTLKPLRYALTRAVTWRYVTENAAAAVEMPSEPDYDAHPFDSWAEVRRTMDAATNPRDRALILLPARRDSGRRSGSRFAGRTSTSPQAL